MNYELAKELKEAGFPQKTGMYARAEKCDCKVFGLDALCHMAYIPTLSELIEACGEGFASLHKTNKQTDHNELSDWWVAKGLLAEPATYGDREGATPQEAVARLWLALNRPAA